MRAITQNDPKSLHTLRRLILSSLLLKKKLKNMHQDAIGSADRAGAALRTRG